MEYERIPKKILMENFIIQE